MLRLFVPSMDGSMIDAFCSVRTERNLEGLLEELLSPAQVTIVLAWPELINKRTQTYTDVSGVLGCCHGHFVWTLPWCLAGSRQEKRCPLHTRPLSLAASWAKLNPAVGNIAQGQGEFCL